MNVGGRGEAVDVLVETMVCVLAVDTLDRSLKTPGRSSCLNVADPGSY